MSAAAIRRRFGQDAVKDWNTFEHEAVARVRANLARYGIDAQVCEEGELMLADSPQRWAAMQAGFQPPDTKLLDRATLRDEGLETATYLFGRLVPCGFGLHPYRYVTGLARAALDAGVSICGDSRVLSLQSEAEGWRLRTAQGSVSAKQVLMATNGYSDEALNPWLSPRILPAISNIMVTRPLTGAELQAQEWKRQLMTYDNRTLLHYFRLLRKRSLGTTGRSA